MIIIKLSEALSEVKRTEGELMRLWELRDNIIKSENETLRYNSNLTPDIIEVTQKKFLKEKAIKVTELDNQISTLKSKLVELKTSVNRRNVEVGIDGKLQEIKYMRIELSKLMNVIKRGNSRYSDKSLDNETRSALSLDERIKVLEKEKAALDAEIQKLNWSTNL